VHSVGKPQAEGGRALPQALIQPPSPISWLGTTVPVVGPCLPGGGLGPWAQGRFDGIRWCLTWTATLVRSSTEGIGSVPTVWWQQSGFLLGDLAENLSHERALATGCSTTLA